MNVNVNMNETMIVTMKCDYECKCEYECDYECECDYEYECDYECGCDYACEHECECECECDYDRECDQECECDYECEYESGGQKAFKDSQHKEFSAIRKHAEKLTKKSKILENAKVHKTSLCLGAFWGP